MKNEESKRERERKRKIDKRFFLIYDMIDLRRYSFVRILCVNVDNDDQNISMYNNNKDGRE